MRILKSFILVIAFTGILPTNASASDLESAAEHLMIQNILKQAGVMALLYQLPDWIDQEIQNLEATAVPFETKELEFVREDLEANFSALTLKQKLMERLSKDFNIDELRKVHHLYRQPEIKKFHSLQEGTQSEYIRADIRSYKAKLKNANPRGSRVEMVAKLDNNLKQSDLETNLKVELRKSLLMSVSWIKSQEKLNENMLDRALVSYRQRVGDEIDRNALIFYLYLFKRTPSNQLESLVSVFSEPEFVKFMGVCEDVMLSSIREARQQIPENMNLANN